MNKVFSLSSLLFFFAITFMSCETNDLANTASAVEGTYQVSSISAKTEQGQTAVAPQSGFDQIKITKTDDREVKIDLLISSAQVFIGTSRANILKGSHENVLVEGNLENGTFNLTKDINPESGASLIGTMNNGQLSLRYVISGTELFSINASRP